MDRSRNLNSRESWGDFQEVTYNNPGFRALLASGEPLPDNPYFWYRIDGKSPLSQTYNGNMTERDAVGFWSFYASCLEGCYILQAGGRRGPSFDSLDDVHSILGNKLLAKVRDSPIDLGVSLGEYRETAELVVGAISKTAGLVKNLKKHSFSEALRVVTGNRNKRTSDVARAAADAWLSFNLGVKPLVSDVHGAMELLGSGNPWIGVKTIRVSHKTLASSRSEYEIAPGQVHQGYCSGRMKGTAKMNFFVENPLLFTMDQLGIVNPFSLGWELVPASFILDYYVDVGSYLRGIIPPQGVKFLSGYTYVKGTGNAESRTDYDVNPAPGWHTRARSFETFKSRRVLTSFPRPTLIVPDLSLSNTQIGNQLGILANLVANLSDKLDDAANPGRRRR